MNKVRLFTLITIAAMLFTLIPAASASGPAGNWASGISCQNLSSTTAANITLYYYQEDISTATLIYADPNPVPASGFRGYYTPNVSGLVDGFLGSVVVSSNTEMACNVNTQTTGAGTQADPYRMGTSAGFNSGQVSTIMYAPQVVKQFYGYGSYISVQNTGSTATTVTVYYWDRAGNALTTASESISIPGNTNHIFYQDENTNLPSNFVGGAKVVSNTNPIAVTVEFYASGVDFKSSQLHSYNGFASGANKLLIPRFVVNYYGYNSGLTIQNVGANATKVTINFKDVAGNSYTYVSGSIPAGASLALYLPDVTELDPMESLPLQQSYGNAVVTADAGGSVVAIVNEDNRGGVSKGYVVPDQRIGQGATYNAFLDGSQSYTVFFPQIPDKAGGIFSGGFAFSNTTTTAGTCNVAYANNAQANQSNLAMAASGTISIYAPNVPNLPDGFNASVTVTCTVPVIGIGNFAADPQIATKRYGDSFTESNGLNQ
jgi:hypothetical protein